MSIKRALPICQFGNPVLRTPARRLSHSEILSETVQEVIQQINFTLERARTRMKYGVGLAAPQIGKGLAVFVIDIKPTNLRPNNPEVHLVVINPEITRVYGRKAAMWEGCMSFGTGSNSPYAQTLRYKKVRVRYTDEHAKQHEADFEGLVAQIMQHETDHLNGVLFVDRVKDTKTYITKSEYKKRYLNK